jgi:uncharacterized membrane protein (UPF0136 family)
MPLASFPLMALAQQGADESMKTDNPYMVAAMIFFASLAVPVALIAYFRLQRRGRMVSGIAFGALDWLVTVPITMTAGLSLHVSLTIATVSSAVLVFSVIRFGANLAAFFRSHDIARTDADRD